MMNRLHQLKIVLGTFSILLYFLERGQAANGIALHQHHHSSGSNDNEPWLEYEAI